MTGNLIGEPFEEFVANQINVRQKSQFSGYGTSLRNNNPLQYLNNRNAWVKLASSIDILPDKNSPSTPEEFVAQRYGLEFTGTTIPLGESKLINIGFGESEAKNYLGSKLAEKAILFNTLSSFDPTSKSYPSPRAGISDNTNLWNDTFIYGIGGTDYGIQPPPGITGVTIDSLNRGSIRKASVTLKAHNKFQFDIIELLYLRLGFTMMLEWGWDKYLADSGIGSGTIQQVGNTIIEERWFTSKGISQLEMLGYIQETREKYDGNYDGFFGKVSNFTWNFNPDGSYDISIDLITVGDVIESLKVNTSNKQEFKTSAENLNLPIDQIQNLKDSSIEKAATLNTIGNFLYQKIGEVSISGSLKSPNNTVDYYFLNGVKSKPPQRTGGFSNNIGVNAVGTTTTFDPSSNQKYFYYIRLGEFLSQLENKIIPKIQNDGKTPYSQITFGKSNNRISYFPNQIPTDPKVCIFKPFLNTYGDITGVNSPSYFNELAPYLQTNTAGATYGLLMNLYLNINFISDLLLTNGGPDQELSLFKFLQDICTGINNALGGVNKLEPVIKDDSTIVLIDQTYYDHTLDSVNNNKVDLEVYGYNPDNQTSNFVKDIKFVSKITPQLASMISIGATAAGSNTSEIDGTAFSKWSEGLVDRYSLEIVEPNSNQPSKQTLPKEQFYRSKFNQYDVYSPPPSAVVAQGPVAVGLYTVASWLTDLFTEDPNTTKRDTSDTEIRIIDDPKYSPKKEKMTFAEFYIKAYAIDKQLEELKVYTPEEINERVGTNYAIYLFQAFGGISNQVKVFYPYLQKTRDLTIEAEKSRYLEFNDTFISQGKSAYQNYINNLNNERYRSTGIPSSEIGFIPLSFDLILDGISGIKIYNKLNINNRFLPSNYPDALGFIITKVNHNISNNSWETSLSTISIPKTQPYELISTDSTTPSPTTNEGISNTLVQNQEFKGLLQPLKNMVGAYESNSSYDIANIGGSAKISRTKVLNLSFTELKQFQTLPQGNPNRVFAAGKYQVIPDTLDIIIKGLNLTPNDRFSAETQEKIGDYIFLNIRKNTGNYLSGKNSGTEADLEAAIQGIGQEFASMPVIYSKTNQKVGDVRTGSGQAGFYGGTGANPSQSKLGVKEMARVLIQTRINYSNKAPVFIPIYFNL